MPRLLACVVAVDIAMRFMSIDPLTFRAWEALSRFRPPGAPFEPNRRYVQPRSYGDTAAMGNLPEWREYHAERFTTDSHGFRNVTGSAAAPWVVVTGDSFAVGSGVDDQDTLPSRLSRLLGGDVYNAAGVDVEPDRLLPLVRQLGMRRGLVLYVYSEDRELPAVPSARKLEVNALLAWATRHGAGVVGRVRGLVEVSPLRILAEKAFKRLANDRFLPNGYRASAIRGQLRNGDTMLFAADRVRLTVSERRSSAAYWSWLRGALQKEDFDLLVVLVPSKYTVYGPLLIAPAATTDGNGYLDRLERDLRDAGVAALNLAPALSARAASDVDRHLYLYRRDDIHWNDRGIELAAAIVGSQLARLLCRQPVTLAASEPGARLSAPAPCPGAFGL
jgi:acetyltransferase AlgX (SGNH hydrolase-like protein)